MAVIKKIMNVFSFIVGGVIAIAVGFFMLRGTMRMWDKNKDKSKPLDEDNSKNP